MQQIGKRENLRPKDSRARRPGQLVAFSLGSLHAALAGTSASSALAASCWPVETANWISAGTRHEGIFPLRFQLSTVVSGNPVARSIAAGPPRA